MTSSCKWPGALRVYTLCGEGMWYCFLKNATVFMNSDSLVYLYKQKKTEHWITWSDDDDGMSYADLKRLFKKLDRESTWCNYCHEVKEKSLVLLNKFIRWSHVNHCMSRIAVDVCDNYCPAEDYPHSMFHSPHYWGLRKNLYFASSRFFQCKFDLRLRGKRFTKYKVK